MTQVGQVAPVARVPPVTPVAHGSAASPVEPLSLRTHASLQLHPRGQGPSLPLVASQQGSAPALMRVCNNIPCSLSRCVKDSRRFPARYRWGRPFDLQRYLRRGSPICFAQKKAASPRTGLGCLQTPRGSDGSIRQLAASPTASTVRTAITQSEKRLGSRARDLVPCGTCQVARAAWHVARGP